MVYPITDEIARAPLLALKENPSYSLERTVGSKPKSSFRGGQRRLRTELHTPLPRDHAIKTFHAACDMREVLENLCLEAFETLNGEPLTQDEINLIKQKEELEDLADMYRSLGVSFLDKKAYDQALEVFTFFYENRSLLEAECGCSRFLDNLPMILAVTHCHLGDLQKAASYLLLEEDGFTTEKIAATLFLEGVEGLERFLSIQEETNYSVEEILLQLYIFGEDSPLMEKIENLSQVKERFLFSGDYEKAIAYMSRRIKEDGLGPASDHYTERALLHLLKGNLEKALEDFAIAAALEKEFGRAPSPSDLYRRPSFSIAHLLGPWLQTTYGLDEATVPEGIIPDFTALSAVLDEAIRYAFEHLENPLEIGDIREFIDGQPLPSNDLNAVISKFGLFIHLLESLYSSGKIEETIYVLELLATEFDTALQLAPDYTLSMLSQLPILLLTEKNDVQKAALFLKKFLSRSSRSDAYFEGLVELALGDRAAAIERFKRADFSSEPEKTLLFLEVLGEDFTLTLEDPDDLEDLSFEELCLLNKEYDKILETVAPIDRYRALVLALQGNYGEALLQYDALLGEEEELSYYLERGLVHLLSGDEASCRADLEQIISLAEGEKDFDVKAEALFLLEWLKTR
ncbi:MAG: tetratricopeptide repeat protein [Verrucomicrobia bacterium]|nr:tetratricopeptide repeat protein [Verrucomicrobiota bacterium]